MRRVVALHRSVVATCTRTNNTWYNGAATLGSNRWIPVDPHGDIRMSCRVFSTDVAREKLRTIMEEYRQANYTQTLPKRFLKTVLDATDLNQDGKISVSELQTLLNNIGASDKMSPDEIKQVIGDLVEQDGNQQEDEDMAIPISKIQELYLEKSKK